MTPLFKLVLCLLAAMVFALVMVACGGGSDDSTSSTDPVRCERQECR